MSHPSPPGAPEFRLVAYLDADEELRTLHISFDALAIARERGWMVWDDVVTAWQAPCAQGDGDPGG